MTEHHPFRFGASIHAASRAELTERIRKIENSGYSTVVVGDHMSMNPLAPLSTLATITALTKSLRLASHVFSNDFWHPVRLVHEAATIDVLSDGRLELGLGTGWLKEDYEQSGIPFDPPGVRVSRLIEAIKLIKELFADKPVTFSGNHYTVSNLNVLPKPVQRPHPPIFIGGGGKRMLSLAAREADIVGLNPLSTTNGRLDMTTITVEATTQKTDWVRQAAGERFTSLELHILLLGVIVTDDRQQAAEQWARDWEAWLKKPLGLTITDILESPYVLIGTIDQMATDLWERRQQYGVSYFTVFPDDMEIFIPLVTQLAGK